MCSSMRRHTWSGQNGAEIKQLKHQQNKQANWKRGIVPEIDFSENGTFEKLFNMFRYQGKENKKLLWDFVLLYSEE